MEWNVRIETASPDDVVGPEAEEVQDRFSQLLDKLESHGAVGGLDENGWNVVVTVDVHPDDESLGHLAAIIEGRSLILSAAEAAGVPHWRVVELCAVESELDWARNDLPNFPEIVGSAEVLAMLGVSKQRLWQLRGEGRFPDPMVELGATPVWMRAAVERFVETWDRRPGRPKSIQEILADNDELEEDLGNLGRPNT